MRPRPSTAAARRYNVRMRTGFFSRARVRAFVFTVAAAGVTASATDGAAAPGDPRIGCAQLASMKWLDVKITEAVAVPAGATGGIRTAHCRVNGVIGTETKFTVLLPDAWNGRFLMGGGGGFVGTVQNSAQATVNLGYATAGTDTGHQGSGIEAGWALNNVERRVNFGYLAVHRTAELSKAIVASHYGSGPSKSYFSGCSRGGGQAVMEAIRYPDDFDGIVAGAPALDWTGIGAQFIKDAQAAYPDGRHLEKSLLTPETMKTIGEKVLETCDAIDGVKDGVIDDPRRCKVDMKSLPLTDAQRTAAEKIYGPTTAGGEIVQPGQPFGGEIEPAGWQAWITGTGAQGARPNQPGLRYAFGNPACCIAVAAPVPTMSTG